MKEIANQVFFKNISVGGILICGIGFLFPSSAKAFWCHCPNFFMPAEQITNPGNKTNDQNIALHKAVVDSFSTGRKPGEPWRFLVWGEGVVPGNMQKAVDGDPGSCIDDIGSQGFAWVELDLGSMFIIDSTNISFQTDYPVNQQYWVRVGTPTDPKLPPTYNLQTGLGLVPHSDTYWGTSEYKTTDPVNGNGPIPVIDFRPAIAIDDAQKVDGRKWNPTPARFLHFNFGGINTAGWPQLIPCEIQVFGHPYTPSPNDDVYVSRLKWIGSAYASSASDVGSSVRQAFDGLIGNIQNAKTNLFPGAYFKIDMVDTSSFNKLVIIFNQNLPPVIDMPKIFNLFATADSSNWGTPIATVDYKDTSITTFPLQTGKRFFKIVSTGSTPSDSWFIIDEILLYKPYANSIPLRIKKSSLEFSNLTNGSINQIRKFNLLGKRLKSTIDVKVKG